MDFQRAVLNQQQVSALLNQQRSDVSGSVQNPFDTHAVLIKSKEEHVGPMRAGSQSWPQIEPFGVSQRSQPDLSRATQEFVFKLICAFGAFPGDQFRDPGEVHLRLT